MAAVKAGVLMACVLLAGALPRSWAVDLNERAATQATAAQAPVDAALTEARDAIARRDWAQAVAVLQEAERRHPPNADVHNLLGLSLRMQGVALLPQAMEHYRQALQLDAQHQGAHEYIGQGYLMLGQPDDAQRHLDVLERLCGGRQCSPYRQLSDALATYRQSGTPPSSANYRYSE